jgi:hypothetical protein
MASMGIYVIAQITTSATASSWDATPCVTVRQEGLEACMLLTLKQHQNQRKTALTDR